jgi:hypothetical protein
MIHICMTHEVSYLMDSYLNLSSQTPPAHDRSACLHVLADTPDVLET